MRSDAATTRPTTPRTWRAGSVWGLALGLSIWVLYFIQATTVDFLVWDVMVVPTILGVSAVALVVAARRRSLRSFCVGLAGGVLAILPLVLLAFGLLFVALDLE